MNFNPIGYIRTVYTNKNGTPRQGNICQESHGTLEVNLGDNNAQYALENLHEFSHVWIIFVFHKNGKAFTKTKVTPPRLSSRVGVFSTRSPHRPNPIGLSLVRLESIEHNMMYLSGIDLLDGTPVLDVKPYVPSYDSPSTLEGSKQETIKFPDWIKKTSSLTCSFTSKALSDLKKIDKEDLVNPITSILEADPRSCYRKDKCSDKLYFFSHDGVHLTAWFDDEDNMVQILKAKIDDQI
ncbi:tRNA (adenine(37)-N6)-methyltransferase [Lepeophtheirus salmonis]|nr:tRNA (adenine(37)-N6)-methyltransferase-like [Lepeophtheirus salmonis]